MARVGDRVVRIKDVGTGKITADVEGIVVQVIDRVMAGGVRQRLKVRWSNNRYVGSVDDRQIKVLSSTPEV